MFIRELKAYGGSEELVRILSRRGLKTLYPPQEEAVKAGLLKDSVSFVVAAPTASGKTLIAEMAALETFLGARGKTIYLVPLRALAREKYVEFTKNYGGTNLRVFQSTGDYDSSGLYLGGADLLITTNEKMDSLLRHGIRWLERVNLIVADEVHLIGDPGRGPTLEMVLTRLRVMNPGLRILALSATIPNSSEIARWLDARLVESNWRPVPLKEGVYFNGAIMFNDGTVKWIPDDTPVEAVNLALDTVKEGGQAIIFVNTRRAAETVALKAMSHVKKLIGGEVLRDLKKLSEDILDTTSEPTRLCKKLSEHAASGAAFHHAGVNGSQRRLVEDAFRGNRLKVLSATTTLAMGMNLPARRVIIKDWWRYETGFGMQEIPVIEIKQMAGRAGRPGYDRFGEAVIMARSRRDERRLFEEYILGEPEDIKSRLGSEAALRTHVLALIAGGFTRKSTGLLEFLKKTFFGYREGAGLLRATVESIIDFLISAEMVVRRGKDLFMATPFGRKVTELYIDPLSGIMLLESLRMRKKKTDLALLHMIARTPDMARLALRKKDMEKMLSLFYEHGDELLIQREELYPVEEVLGELKTAAVLMEWMNEVPEDSIVGSFQIGPGDIRTLVELSDWLMYSASELALLFKLEDAARRLSLLRTRVRYGVKEELLGLVVLKGIGRVRARNLFNAGFRGLGDIRGAEVKELAAVPSIGMAIARDIKQQALG